MSIPSIELICAARLLDCLHEIVELNYPIDDDHRKVMQETDDAIGRQIGDMDDRYRDYRNPLPNESGTGQS